MHLHTCALDGVYVEAEEGEDPRFVPRAPPSRAELYVLAERIALRVTTWLRKRGHVKDDDHASNDAKGRTFAEVLAQLATQRGVLENVKEDTGESEGPAEPAAPFVDVDEAVTRHGFNLHASLTIDADDDLGRERLCRYGLRPPFSLSRFRVLRDGRRLVSGEEVVAARLALPDHDAHRVHREALRARAAAALPLDEIPWCPRTAGKAPASYRAEAARERHARMRLGVVSAP